MRKNFTDRHFKPILKKAELPSIRLYDLRHTMATLLLSESVNPKIVQERLGHSSIVLTLDTYSHVLPTMQEDATAKLENLHKTG
jgi:integrase